jgi:hypothetical protein
LNRSAAVNGRPLLSLKGWNKSAQGNALIVTHISEAAKMPRPKAWKTKALGEVAWRTLL